MSLWLSLSPQPLGSTNNQSTRAAEPGVTLGPPPPRLPPAAPGRPPGEAEPGRPRPRPRSPREAAPRPPPRPGRYLLGGRRAFPPQPLWRPLRLFPPMLRLFPPPALGSFRRRLGNLRDAHARRSPELAASGVSAAPRRALSAAVTHARAAFGRARPLPLPPGRRGGRGQDVEGSISFIRPQSAPGPPVACSASLPAPLPSETQPLRAPRRGGANPARDSFSVLPRGRVRARSKRRRDTRRYIRQAQEAPDLFARRRGRGCGRGARRCRHGLRGPQVRRRPPGPQRFPGRQELHRGVRAAGLLRA